MAKQKKGMSFGKEVTIGAGVAAVGAGAYYLLGPKAKAHQKKASALIGKIKKEVTKDIKKVKNLEKSGSKILKELEIK
jgi:hypothetical protein